jgi:hypothetical protein
VRINRCLAVVATQKWGRGGGDVAESYASVQHKAVMTKGQEYSPAHQVRKIFMLDHIVAYKTDKFKLKCSLWICYWNQTVQEKQKPLY